MLYAAFNPDDENEVVEGFSENDVIPENMDNRNAILELEAKMMQMESSIDECPTTHHFAPGVYAREIFIPAGHTVVGKLHKHAHLTIVSKGRLRLSTEDGSEEITAPCTFTSCAGTKRAVHVLEDTIWTTIHPTEETDLAKIEDSVIAKTYEEFDSFIAIQDSRDDYASVCVETGFSHEALRAMSDNKEDYKSIENDNIRLGDSSISGTGVFATCDIKKGDIIGVARAGIYRSELGKYVNHSSCPNAEYIPEEDGLLTVATSNISKDSEITYNYRQGAKLYGVVFKEI